MLELDIAPLQILTTKLNDILAAIIKLSPNLLAALLWLVITWIIARFVGYILVRSFKRTNMRHALSEALTTLFLVLIWITGIGIAAMIALPGLTPSKLLAGLGIGSIAIGLAFKDIFENFLAGLLILMREPMRIGDFIECEDVSGQVQTIRIRDTYLRRTDGVLVMLPNAMLFKNPVRVLTDLDRRRQKLIVGVAYGEDVGKARQVIRSAIEGVESLDKQRPLQVFAREFSSSSIDFEVVWWTGSKPVDVRRSRDEVVEAIKVALDEATIEIPFPYRTLTFKDGLEIRHEEAEEGAH